MRDHVPDDFEDRPPNLAAPTGGASEPEEVKSVARSHRHSRAHVGHHFVRVALKRRRAYLDILTGSPGEHQRLDLALGQFDDGQPYFGCPSPVC